MRDVDRDRHVRHLQQLLRVPPVKQADNQLYRAILHYQRVSGLSLTGKLDPQTLAKLEQEPNESAVRDASL